MGRLTGFFVLLVALVHAVLAGADPPLASAVEALARDPSLKVRTQAALLLGRSRDAGAVPALAQALELDPSPAVRIAAAAALGELGSEHGRAALATAARVDADAGVREAAERALEILRRRGDRGRGDRGRGDRVVSIAEPQGGAADGPARSALRDALGRHLTSRGFTVRPAGAAAVWQLKPAVLSLDVTEAGGATVIAVKASVVAVDHGGRMAAMVESGARLKATGGTGGGGGALRTRLAAKALDAAAKTLSEDLANQLQ